MIGVLNNQSLTPIMKYKNSPIYVALLVSVSNFSSAETTAPAMPLSSLAERVEVGEIEVPHIKTDEEVEAEEEFARLQAETKAEVARLSAEAVVEAARIKELAASEKDAEEKIEQVKEMALAVRVTEDKSRESEVEAAMAEAKAKSLRVIADKDAELAKKAAGDNVIALNDAELAITRAKGAGSKLFDNIKVGSEEEEEEGVKGGMSVAESIVTVEHDEVSKSYRVEKGGSLSLISVQAYGRAGYWRILKLHNGVSPEKLKLGQKVKAPDLKWLMADSGLTKVFPVACRDLLESRRLFMELEGDLDSSKKSDSVMSAEEISKKMNKAEDLMRNSRKLFMKRRSGVKGSPNSVAQQLFVASNKMAEVVKGKKDIFSVRGLVHEHISNSIVYSVLWAKDGFN